MCSRARANLTTVNLAAKRTLQSLAIIVFGIPVLLLVFALIGWIVSLIYQALTGDSLPDI